MNILFAFLLAMLLLTLDACGDKNSGKTTEAAPPTVAAPPVALEKASDVDEKLAQIKKVAEAGNEEAQVNLGWIYFNGHGATQDYQKAMNWFHLAAAQGNSSAQLAIGKMYSSGKGVAQDYVRAQMWFILAAAEGDSEAQQILDIGAKHLTSAQNSQAKKFAQDCKGSNYKNCG